MDRAPRDDDIAAFARLVQFTPHGRGHHLSRQKRALIVYACNVLHLSSSEIHSLYFQGHSTDPLVTIGRIRDIINAEVGDAQRYVQGPYKRTGRPQRKLTRSSMESYVLMEMFREREYTCVYYLWLDFRREYYVNPNDAPSYASVILRFHIIF